MKIGADSVAADFDVEKIVVQIKTAGKFKSGKNKGKMGYMTVDSVDVTDAQPSEVVAAVMSGLKNAAAKR